MPWEVRINRSDVRHTGLATDSVRDYLVRGLLSSEDWVRSSPEDPWRQIATVDEFDGAVAATGGGRRHRRPVRESADLDMTPMIDMTFLLLIFFMVTGSFHMQKGLDFPPDKTQDTAETDRPVPGLADFGDRIIVELSERDQFQINRGTQPGQGPASPVSVDKVVESIRSEAREAKKNKVLILPHELSSHEAVVAIIDASALAGITDISVADITTPPLPRASASPKIIRRN